MTIDPDIEAILTIAPRFRRSIARPSRLAGQEHARQVDVHHPLPLFERHLLGRRGVGDAGAVDRERQRTQHLLRLLDRGGQGRAVDDVAGHDQRAPALLLDGSRGVLEALARRHVEQRDVGAGLRETDRDALTDPAASARHEGDFVFQAEQTFIARLRPSPLRSWRVP